jgi:hypothetical protein
MAESDKPSKADDNIAALRIKYEALTGKCPFVGWSAEMLKSEIAAINDQIRRELKFRRRGEWAFEWALKWLPSLAIPRGR